LTDGRLSIGDPDAIMRPVAMSELPPRPRFQRARRATEKAQRRDAIVSAAGALLESSGFEGFSMSTLGRKAGVAKGTLYLYFETREEVLLALYVEKLEAWVDGLAPRLREGLSDEAFAEAFERVSLADPSFLTLRGRLESVIEHNVSVDRLVEAKRAMRDLIGAIAPRIEQVLGLGEGSGLPLLVALAALELGAAQSRMGPSVVNLELPEDVAEFMRVHSEYDAFRKAAPMLIAGFRSGRDRA
jgi:AcrR family transcriptional regulator